MNLGTDGVISSKQDATGKSKVAPTKGEMVVGVDGSSDDGTSSLEESVEEHKQPQTEEIMNAELIAGVC